MTVHVYRLYDSDDVLLYVGMTARPKARIGEHYRRAAWAGCVASVKVDSYDTRTEAAYHEMQAIRDESPLHNVQHGSDLPSPHASLKQVDARRAQLQAELDSAVADLDRYDDALDQLRDLMEHEPTLSLSEALRRRAMERAS